MKRTLNIFFAVMAVIIGLYPAIYFIIDRKFGLLQSKTSTLLKDIYWNTGFYFHIILGGIALLIGWTQFNKNLRTKRIHLHRKIGNLYVATAVLSALSSLYISWFATGGWITGLGFFLLGIIWFYTTCRAFIHIRNKQVNKHQQLMIYSYAACFAAVTLRVWLPLLTVAFHDFIIAYRISAYLCWIPNIIIANYLVKKLKQTASYTEFYANN
jgi:uncharacterized membrane protein